MRLWCIYVRKDWPIFGVRCAETVICAVKARTSSKRGKLGNVGYRIPLLNLVETSEKRDRDEDHDSLLAVANLDL